MYGVPTEYAKFKSIAYIFRYTKSSAHLQLSIFVVWWLNTSEKCYVIRSIIYSRFAKTVYLFFNLSVKKGAYILVLLLCLRPRIRIKYSRQIKQPVKLYGAIGKAQRSLIY